MVMFPLFLFSISIHALTGSATRLYVGFFFFFIISIHALTGSATLALDTGVKLIDNFNPRTHGECDLDLYVGLVSRQNFNPRTRMGCDRYV